jgi:hypothetical protein
MSEIRPSVEIKRDITSVESQIKSVTRTLEILERPFATLKNLDAQAENLRNLIENEKDGRVATRLKRQLESVLTQIDSVKKSITNELDRKIQETKKSLEELGGRLEELKKELEFVLKVEEEQRIRNSRTVVRLINIPQILGGTDTISLTVNQGQRLEYLRSVDSGNVYMKLSKLGTSEEFVGTIKSIDYKSIFVQEDKFVGDAPQPEAPIKVFPKSDSGISNGGETMYFTQVMDFQTTIRLSLGLGFVAFDVDRQDGDLSIWVLLSGGDKAA